MFEADGKPRIGQMAEVAAPMLVARGDRDGEIGPAGLAVAVADALPNGELRHYPHLNHFGPFQDPDTLGDDALAHFARWAPRRRPRRRTGTRSILGRIHSGQERPMDDPSEFAADRGYRPFDADNHYYEALDAFTRHLDPRHATRVFEWAQIGKRSYPVLGGTVFRGVKNATFDPVAPPVSSPTTSAATPTTRTRWSCCAATSRSDRSTAIGMPASE